MKYFLLIISIFLSVISFAQNKYQFSLGAGHHFLSNVKLKTGNIGLNFKADKFFFIDVNRTINKEYGIAAGITLKVNLASFWYELDTSIPYRAERPHIPIFQGESAELNPYIKKYILLHSSKKINFNSFIQAGVCFNISEGSAEQNRHGIRDDNDQSFLITKIFYKAQKPYIPYARITAGLEFHKKIGGTHFLGISPFISWAGLQSENHAVTVLPDDPTYISTGSFKRNRSGYGIRVIFSK